MFASLNRSSNTYPFKAPNANAFAALDSAITIAIYAPDIAIIVPIALKIANKVDNEEL